MLAQDRCDWCNMRVRLPAPESARLSLEIHLLIGRSVSTVCYIPFRKDLKFGAAAKEGRPGPVDTGQQAPRHDRNTVIINIK
jgi:hypothetical protein